MIRAFSEAVEGGDVAGALRKLAPGHPDTARCDMN
jgi:hypothetical protein